VLLPSVDDFVAALSADERERFKDLIEDCRQRERQIRASAIRAQRAVSGLEASQVQFDHEVRRLHAASQRALEAVTDACLRTTDWSKAPRA